MVALRPPLEPTKALASGARSGPCQPDVPPDGSAKIVAAVHSDTFTGDEGGLIGSWKRDGRGDIYGGAHADLCAEPATGTSPVPRATRSVIHNSFRVEELTFRLSASAN